RAPQNNTVGPLTGYHGTTQWVFSQGTTQQHSGSSHRAPHNNQNA
ncbi:hypothetical protein A2U01_0112964, partial [Trifolium medium]|nr:hypothetical protein [Trifolium medium]